MYRFSLCENGLNKEQCIYQIERRADMANFISCLCTLFSADLGFSSLILFFDFMFVFSFCFSASQQHTENCDVTETRVFLGVFSI